ncbi:MAG: hypothetical protein IJ282_07400 [Lachnospiraceae bacterium]|nr:hypothetical protein [Lachnospiraceae bacterium]
MYYHASEIKDIEVLEPRTSNHGIPLIYFSKKRENVLVYLSNAVEKYCKETNFSYNGIWQKWAAYGFRKEGKQRIEEYYPNALEKTYKGVSGYIYMVDEITESNFQTNIPDVTSTDISVKISDVEFIPDAYTAILEAEKNGLISIMRYEEMTEKMREWNRKTIKKEYEEAVEHPEYRHFLRGNFSEFLEEFED